MQEVLFDCDVCSSKHLIWHMQLQHHFYLIYSLFNEQLFPHKSIAFHRYVFFPFIFNCHSLTLLKRRLLSIVLCQKILTNINTQYLVNEKDLFIIYLNNVCLYMIPLKRRKFRTHLRNFEKKRFCKTTFSTKLRIEFE